MAFNFGAASTPSLFGSTPAFGAASTPAFGAASTPAFGAASTPSLFGGGFGAPSSAASLFGASAPAFGAPSSPSLFGSSAPAFGQSQAGFSFGQQSAPSFQLGQPQQQQAAPQSAGVLATADNKPLTHHTKWEEISPAGQKQLLELEKLISQTREECRQLEECPRLQDSADDEPSTSEAALEHMLRGFGSTRDSDEEAVAALKQRVHGLLHDTETAVRTFQRSYQWREAAKNPGQVLPPALRELLAGPVVLPSHFLRRTVAAFQETVAEYRATVAELERLLPAAGAGVWQPPRQPQPDGDGALAALPAALSNIHDLLFHTAAKIDALSERLEAAKAAHLQRLRQAGDHRDPFREAERRERQKEQAERDRVTVIPPASGPAPPATGQAGPVPAAAAGVLALPAPGGAFASGAQPGAVFGQPAAGAAQDSGRTRKAKVRK